MRVLEKIILVGGGFCLLVFKSRIYLSVFIGFKKRGSGSRGEVKDIWKIGNKL